MKKVLLTLCAVMLSFASFAQVGGYFTPLYGEDYGFGPYTDTNTVVANMRTLLNNRPRPNHAPVVSIVGQANVVAGQTATFTAQIVSIDPVTSISWNLPDGTPSTSSSATVNVTWATGGTKTISCTVTNTTGSTTATLDVNVRDGWSWGDEMDYTDGGDMVSALGLQSGAEFQWGVVYPASLLTGRNYVTKVSAYINDGVTGTYTVRIYQGGTTAPTTLVYENPFTVTESGQYVDFTIPGGLNIDQTQSLWVTLSTSGYAASYTTYNGDPNSTYLTLNNQWYTMSEATSGSYEGTWMIKTTTSATAPAFDFILNGPTSGTAGSQLTFAIAGRSDATYNWTFEDGTPATATGTTATASWALGGDYTVSVTGIIDGTTITKTMDVNIFSCDITLPYSMGFESTDPVDCWTFVDADGDGFGWVLNSEYNFSTVNTGSGSLMSASYINGEGALTPDNWAISPAIEVPSTGATIEWYSGALDASYANDYYSVLVSTTNNSTSSFTQTLYAGQNEAAAFTHHSVSLTQFAGQTIYIAFRHHNCTDVYWLAIDDISINIDGAAAPQLAANNITTDANMLKSYSRNLLSIDPKSPAAKNGAKSDPEWLPIQGHFTCNDIDGNSISSEAILASGKCIVIDYSATWCSWCWVMHENGTLDAIHHQLGDQIYVIWADVDPSTTVSQIRGQGSTQGDWTNGGTIPYPIINDDATEALVGSDYVTGYPTVVLVVPGANSNNINTVEMTDVTLYPNPTSGSLYIAADNVREVSIIDINGRTVMSSNATTIDMSSLNNGIYFVRVITDNGTATKKIVKK